MLSHSRSAPPHCLPTDHEWHQPRTTEASARVQQQGTTVGEDRQTHKSNVSTHLLYLCFSDMLLALLW